ncbi:MULTISPECIES: hypothetical protein [Pectobacterium]|uniref:hypothetical protein n=1 Tax=Pectobacterium TaxID=122277 RepID=UPI0013FDF781|nr:MULTISPECIES: hypothetical protein [Pectobacterium]UVD97656.1 hypothetical protein NV347_00980 [Pectobacterium parvum]
MATINTSARGVSVQPLNQVIPDSNKGKCINKLVGNTEQVKNSSTGFSQQGARSKSSCYLVKFVEYVRGVFSKLLTSQGGKSERAAYGRAASEARMKSATNAESVDKAKQKTAGVEKANKSPVILKMDAKSIPLPPPPPPPPRSKSAPSLLSGRITASNNINANKGGQVKGSQGGLLDGISAKLAKRADKENIMDNKTTASNNINANKLGNKGGQVKGSQDSLIDELSAKLAKRAGAENIMDKNTPPQELKPWQKELAEERAAYARGKSGREAADAKEETRVASAIKAKKAKQEAAKAAETERVNKLLVPLKMDAKGIPLPPPPPLSRSLSYPLVLSNRTGTSDNINANKLGNKGAQVKGLQDDLFAELSAKLAKRAGTENIIDEKTTSQAQKPWEKELAEHRETYARAASDRAASEAKEEARVALALKAEAVEKEKQKAAEAEKANKSSVILKMDANGIPLPPSPVGNYRTL